MSEEKMHPIEGLMDTTLEKIKQMVDVNTVIGTPITTPDGTTVIPISKVVYGFASGGSEFQGKRESSSNLFGGGTGAGVTINPVAFLTISNGDVKLLNIADYKDGQDRAIGMVPEIIDKIAGLFKKDKKEEKADKSADEMPKAGIEDPII
ncbi:MAG: GerW family sporulation protein [Acutalibacteraceae bacterium]